MTRVFKYKGDMFEELPINPKKPDTYIGRVSHRLTVVDVCMRVTEGKAREKFCVCKCECGTIKIVGTRGIRSGRIKSCGCWKSEVDTQKAKDMGDANLKHGMARSRIYKVWDSMRRRCDNPKDKDYKNYGGRGVSYDPRWSNFENFYNDMKEGYREHLTIERIDVNGQYNKDNCTWITMAEQQKNKRNSKGRDKQ